MEFDDSRIATGPAEHLPRRDPLTTAPPSEQLSSLVPILRARLDHAEAWVLFEHGTVVMLEPGPDPVSRAIIKLENDAERRAGSAAGDPAVMRLDDAGWIVASKDPDIFTVVPRASVGPSASDVVIGAAGRMAHEGDMHGGQPLHVEAASG